MPTRRQFLGLGAAAAVATVANRAAASGPLGDASVPPTEMAARYALLDEVAARPVLRRELCPEPLILEKIEFRRHGEGRKAVFVVRVQAKNGAVGIALSNERDIGYLYPVAQQLMIPHLLGQDARDWEALIEKVYLAGSNYKRQGLLFWLPFASIEFAVLDLLARVAGVPVATLLGGRTGQEIAVYHAHDDRTRSAEESVERMVRARERYQTRAAKFKVGGRMRRNAEIVAGRSEAIIAQARAAFGPDFTLYADSNGSFDVARGIEIGRRCEEHGIAIYEEPVPHDQYEETQAVADALTIPVAGGEQESSHNRFRWMIAHRALDVVQPDLFYFGGLVRSIRVARMAHAVGLQCSPHISGTGVGFLYMLHFVAAIPNAGPFQEYKGFDGDLPLSGPASAHTARDGALQVPGGVGYGLELDPAWLAQAVLV